MGTKNQQQSINSPFGQVYVQGGGVGICSYHFEQVSEENPGAYMSNTNVKGVGMDDPNWPLDSGNYPPDKMFFKD